MPANVADEDVVVREGRVLETGLNNKYAPIIGLNNMRRKFKTSFSTIIAKYSPLPEIVTRGGSDSLMR